MTPGNILDVNESNFAYEVLSYSDNLPVVVDFWATWCGPCKTLGPLLERLAAESPAAFRLAKVDVDANPNLALKYGVRSVPTVIAFIQGQVMAQFSGAQPEARVRDFLARLTPPSPARLTVERAFSLLSEHRWNEAENMFRQVLEQLPGDAEAQYGLAKALLPQGEVEEANHLLKSFPASAFFTAAMKLQPLANAGLRYKNGSLETDSELSAAYSNSLRLALRGRIEPALDGLLDILRQDKRYAGGAARDVVVALLEILGEDHPATREYRTELATILF